MSQNHSLSLNARRHLYALAGYPQGEVHDKALAEAELIEADLIVDGTGALNSKGRDYAYERLFYS